MCVLQTAQSRARFSPGLRVCRPGGVFNIGRQVLAEYPQAQPLTVEFETVAEMREGDVQSSFTIWLDEGAAIQRCLDLGLDPRTAIDTPADHDTVGT